MGLCKKVIALTMSATIPLLLTCPAYAAGDIPGKTYTITNPYETVDWDTWGLYKANLHTHTTYSDGEMLLSDVVESYYALDYDILAITDHGVNGTKWTEKPKMVPIVGYYAFINKIDTLSEERYEQITTGSDRGGRGMLNVTQGNEMNCLVLNKNHVNGFFTDYGYAILGVENDYETVIKGNSEAGGITFINHIGDWTKGSGDFGGNDDPKNIQFFADMFMNYSSCVGMEIINSSDSTTKYDRILWDNILQVVLPTGRNVFGFSNDDAHVPSDIGRSFEQFMLPELSQEALRTAMETGTFFSTGKRTRYELGDDFNADIHSPYPTVTRIDVDKTTNVITVSGENYNNIQWVSNGKIIAEGNKIDLNAYEDDITCYVRFQMAGDGGMTFSQPFVVDDGTLNEMSTTVYEPPVYPDQIAPIIEMLNNFKNTKVFFLLELIYKKIID